MYLKIVSVQLKKFSEFTIVFCHKYLEVTLINIQGNPFNGTKPSLSKLKIFNLDGQCLFLPLLLMFAWEHRTVGLLYHPY